MKRDARFPALRAVGGVLLLLAGIFGYFGVGFGASAILVLVLGGAVVLVAAVLGHRPRPADVGIFLVGVLVLGAVSYGYSAGSQVATYSAPTSQVPAHTISLTVSADTGSISVGFTERAGVAYQVNFTRQTWLPNFSGTGVNTVTNSTANGVFHLDVESTWSAVSVVVGRGYALDVQATTSVGSIDMEAPGSSTLGNVTLVSSTGSINAVIDSPTVQNLELRAGTGSVNLVSHGLGAAGPAVPVTLAASTGSVSVSMTLASQTAASLTASTSLGSISQSLRGFTITQDTHNNLVATVGDYQSAPRSFAITVTASLGSIELNIGPA